MATQSPSNGYGVSAADRYKRASRKGAPRRFSCDFPGCDKLYSRAEHLQRHQLNHEPKEIFRCDVAGCEQKFVRADLLARHRKRHSASYIPRNRMPSFGAPKDSSPSAPASAVVSPTAPAEPRPTFVSAPHDAAILLTPNPSNHPPPPALHLPPPPSALPNPAPARMNHPPGWPPHAHLPDMAPCNIIRPKPGYYSREGPRLAEQPSVVPYHSVEFPHDEISRENFAVWLFNPQASYADFSVSNLPFIDGGLESTLNNNIHYDYESLTSSRSQLETPPRFVESDELIGEFRRQEVIRWFGSFRQKQPKSEPLIANIVQDGGGDLPALNVEMMRDCLQEYWEHVSPRLPIVHQPTFSCNRCSIFLLMVMIALGAASLRSRDSSGNLSDYGGFADVLISGVRWEIVTAEEASPPVGLWVAQALLLLEFYEKMYSSRRLHERAHIYHSVALTLLRRGSPLIGRSGSESPPEVASAEHPHGVGLDSRTWWSRWAETEAMHRAVFGLFMLDIIHAAMFGHAADMAPHEIRLPLPCDDNLWTASNPDMVRQLDQNLRMYGVKTISFLDGLKRALHGKPVKTHSFGRMIIMSGLLSVGWHLSHREAHLKWLDLTTQPADAQDNWKRILLKSFDDWKASFDEAQGIMGSPTLADPSGQRSDSNGPIQSAAVLYHLAQISLHVDIVDCQVYAGARRLLGRKVSVRDYANVVARMRSWAALSSTRHAVLHAFKLLHRVLVDPRRSASERVAQTAGGVKLPPIEVQSYSCRNEPDPHRPWIMYYAALCIWSFVRALSRHDSLQEPPIPSQGPLRQTKPLPVNFRRVVAYLSNIATLTELSEQAAMTLEDGLSDLLDALHSIFAEAHSELLQEAHVRMKVCKETLAAHPG
ncbi:fungal-specific transcription factor domain-containing protein [Lasiosphaeria miniovina]|uniref:Fungal-specific transcription factor domain-containing protein n=1 Tax=Lasiosphaeria miniovina TaxID=1954250 RepID=A0AA40B516_9PEZI|nr:fungal-specific transcription factor domain-containing protein [Lasiosphaeria miniovina]KAK0727723.1 fungal-specific transcription factor domain-containing protein [Lasiosphaeria miniovina]